MEISQLESNERMIEFALAGDIVQHFVNPSVTSQFAELNGSGVFGRAVVVDVSDVTFLDSNGIGWFVALDSQFRKNGGRLILHSPSPVLQRIFAMLKMTTVITVAPSREAALTLVNEQVEIECKATFSSETPEDNTERRASIQADHVAASDSSVEVTGVPGQLESGEST